LRFTVGNTLEQKTSSLEKNSNLTADKKIYKIVEMPNSLD